MESIDEYLATLHTECLEAACVFRFDKTHPWHFTLVALYGSVVELTGCVIVLSRYDGYAALGSTFRTLLEAYLDLVNLAQDRSYGRYMDAADAKQMRLIYRKAAETQNPYLAGLRAHESFGQLVLRLDQEIETLKAAGIRPLSVEDRFDRAEMSDLYDGVYRLLCTDTHSNRSALTTRHLDLRGDGDFAVAFYMLRSAQDLRVFLDSAAGILADATHRIHEALDCEIPVGLTARLDGLATVRKTYPELQPPAGA